MIHYSPLINNNYQSKYSLSKIFVLVFILAVATTYLFDVYFNSYSISNSIKNTFVFNSVDYKSFNATPKSQIRENVGAPELSTSTTTVTTTSTSVKPDCQIINSTATLYQINIDGETYPQRIGLYQNASLNFECMNRINKKPKVILLWTTWFGDATFAYGVGKSTPFINNACPVHNCEITNDKARIKESDLVIFHMRDSIDYLPQRPNSLQRWVFFLYESPVHSGNFKQYNGMFNLSATYKLNSDFTTIYTEPDMTWSDNEGYNVNQDFTNGKTDLAVAVVSNCGASSKRLDYIKQMQQLMSIKIMGKCGKPCPEAFDNGTKAKCKEILGEKFKFYFAFENSICEDYITEKLFVILRYNIVPVVYGAGPYHKHIPKSAFINAFDYKSPQELAKYLLYLDSNKTAYNEYFKWKRFVKFTNKAPSAVNMCELCLRLNIDEQYGIQQKVINDMEQFWSTKSNCKRVNDDFSLSSY